MLISYNWLKQYVNLPDSVQAEEVAEKLKHSTVEVEKTKKQNELLGNVVVGKVLKAEKHPNADKLKLCEVDSGDQKLQIVCGGSNVREGMLVAVAKVGAKVRWHGEGGEVVLEPTKIRGVESFGMICASSEIGLQDIFPAKDEKEILDLTEKKFKVGTNLSDALGNNDVVFEVDNKSLSNRPDLWGHYGIAREVAVLYNRDLKQCDTKKIESGSSFKLSVKVEDKKLCPRYMAVAVSGIKIGQSPTWMQEKLTAVGLRPINNIVDITNYVMLDLGQPLHAFDADIIGNKIVVRKAKPGEKIVALDGKECVLRETDLVIADNSEAIALAGVIGGLKSGINENTNTIIFESANFDSSAIRKTSTRLNLRTDSASRFEKSLDPNLCETAISRAVELALACCAGAKVASKVVDEKEFHLPVGPISTPIDVFEKKLGIKIDLKEILNILQRLGFDVKVKKDFLSIKIPTWRATKDVSTKEDIVEEVVRFYGFNKVPSVLPSLPINPPVKNNLRILERLVSSTLVKELSYVEVYNYSFVSAQQIGNLGDDLNKYIELDNPLSKEKPFLRRNLLPNLLDNVRVNIENFQEVKIFEIGKVFSIEQSGARAEESGDNLLPRQDTWVCAMYASKKENNPFWQARKSLEVLFAAMGQNFKIVKADKAQPWEHPARMGLVELFGVVVGSIMEIRPTVTEKLGIEQRIGVLRLNLSVMSELLEGKASGFNYMPALVYPEVARDLAFLVKSEITHEQILNKLMKADPLLKKVELFDVYAGENIGEGYKSMAYTLVFFDEERTLTAQEVDVVVKKVCDILQKEFDAEVRK